jgi:hypothetical protein
MMEFNSGGRWDDRLCVAQKAGMMNVREEESVEEYLDTLMRTCDLEQASPPSVPVGKWASGQGMNGY